MEKELTYAESREKDLERLKRALDNPEPQDTIILGAAGTGEAYTNCWKKCYFEVFNSDGTQKICGRQKCSELIDAMEKTFQGHEPLYFGDKKTGQMHVRHIQDTVVEYI